MLKTTKKMLILVLKMHETFKKAKKIKASRRIPLLNTGERSLLGAPVRIIWQVVKDSNPHRTVLETGILPVKLTT